ncbi:ATP/maltotriose-dependent transcriptional regulator MalT [Actinokineospora baliensis]|uniref:LuxR C-terminal-related transcriptional regulator n=1 Tax=Actinokineospora baliensis TaxID=547056 RepID=UPI00195B2C2A|nr:LuxR C-terminal-related transcriptional regulator [Actinokineospora baliensis]MBM7773512.1 ATP/maltotriose-dependent transcriptional regulator MalT [Actinokineospora baliensis]
MDRSPPVDRAPLVGRASELARLSSATAPALLLVAGEAGIGKSRMVDELRGHPDLLGHHWLVGECPPLREPFPLGPVLDALKGLDVFSPPVGRVDRVDVFPRVRAGLAELGPAVLVVEDLHWSDETTYEFLRFLCRGLPPRLKLLVTYRPENVRTERPVVDLAGYLPRWARAVETTVRPLRVADVGELAAALLGLTKVTDEFATRLHELTGGVPFVVEEVCRALPAEPAPRLADAPRSVLDRLTAPVALRGSIAERLAALPAAVRDVVAAAATLAAPVDEHLLSRVAGLDRPTAAGAIDRALAHGLLRQCAPGLLATRHALATRAVIDLLAPDELRRAHRAAAAALAEANPVPHARLARHCKHAGLVADWVRHAEAAATRAVALGDGDTAVDLLADVVAGSGIDVPTRARVAALLSRAAQPGLRHNEAVAALRSVLAVPDLPEGLRGEIRFGLGMLLVSQTGEAGAGREQLRTAVGELDARPDLAARAMAALAIPSFTSGTITEHLAWAKRALDMLGSFDDHAVHTAVHVNHASVLMYSGDPDGWAVWRAALARGSTPEARLHLLRGASNGADAAVWLGHDARARELLALIPTLVDEDSSLYTNRLVAGTRSRLDFAAGRWTDLAERVGHVRAGAGAHRLPMLDTEARLVSAELALATGALADAEVDLRAITDHNAPLTIPLLTAAMAARARIALSGGRADEAVALLGPALTVVRRHGNWVWATAIVPPACAAMVAVGDRTGAIALHREFAEAVLDRDAPAAGAAALQAAGYVATRAKAADLFAAAQGEYEAMGRPYALLQAREAFAEVRLAGGDKQPMLDVVAGFTDLGARWDAARCAQVLRKHGITPRHRGGRRGYGDALSPREAAVARMAARGSTNKEIAEALFISVRTVEDHVANALRKCGVRTRTDLPCD